MFTEDAAGRNNEVCSVRAGDLVVRHRAGDSIQVSKYGGCIKLYRRTGGGGLLILESKRRWRLCFLCLDRGKLCDVLYCLPMLYVCTVWHVFTGNMNRTCFLPNVEIYHHSGHHLVFFFYSTAAAAVSPRRPLYLQLQLYITRSLMLSPPRVRHGESLAPPIIPGWIGLQPQSRRSPISHGQKRRPDTRNRRTSSNRCARVILRDQLCGSRLAGCLFFFFFYYHCGQKHPREHVVFFFFRRYESVSYVVAPKKNKKNTQIRV